MARAFSVMMGWSLWRWAVAVVAGLIAGAAIGVPTGIVPTTFYTRMTSVTWWDYPVWGVSSLLIGLTAATYVRGAGGAATRRGDPSRRSLIAGLGSAFAVGCPVCNKLVVALLGVGGALDYWAPLQPVLGVASVGLLASGLLIRLRGAAACRVSSPQMAYDKL